MRLTNVVKTYGNKTALSIPSFELEEGKITAVLGESGAGKTTLLNVISGLVPHEGDVEGRVPCSYLDQDAKLLPHLSVRGNLRFILPKNLWKEIDPMLEKVGLGGRERDLPSSLSGGERRRVAIARAFLYPHKLLLMDEPFSSLDLSLKRSLIGLVSSLWRETGSTVVFVTHDVREAVLLSHRAVVLKQGSLIGDFTVPGDPPRPFLCKSPVEDELIRALLGPGCEEDSPLS